MILADTGPLVALIDRRDSYHQHVVNIGNTIDSWPLATTEACLTETLYLLRRGVGRLGEEALWRFIDDVSLIIIPPSLRAPQRAREFMTRYQDQPCDYADATLLVAAEDHGLRRVFTLDRHFYAYRLTNGSSLEVLTAKP